MKNWKVEDFKCINCGYELEWYDAPICPNCKMPIDSKGIIKK